MESSLLFFLKLMLTLHVLLPRMTFLRTPGKFSYLHPSPQEQEMGLFTFMSIFSTMSQDRSWQMLDTCLQNKILQ